MVSIVSTYSSLLSLLGKLLFIVGDGTWIAYKWNCQKYSYIEELRVPLSDMIDNFPSGTLSFDFDCKIDLKKQEAVLVFVGRKNPQFFSEAIPLCIARMNWESNPCLPSLKHKIYDSIVWLDTWAFNTQLFAIGHSKSSVISTINVTQQQSKFLESFDNVENVNAMYMDHSKVIVASNLKTYGVHVLDMGKRHLNEKQEEKASVWKILWLLCTDPYSTRSHKLCTRAQLRTMR